MRVAAYQAPLLAGGSMEAVELIRKRVDWCEAAGVEILCCPEAILGGLADDAARPGDIAIDVESGQLNAVLSPLASGTVTTIVGFAEIAATGQLCNSAAVFHRGSVVGLYRKLYPAIRKSIYRAGDRIAVFTVGGLTFGIVICNDSNYPEPARIIASQGATAIFVPTNNGLPPEKADVVARSRTADVDRERENSVTVVRADVAGGTADRVSYGSSGIVDPGGTVLQSARPLTEEVLVAGIDTSPGERQIDGRGNSTRYPDNPPATSPLMQPSARTTNAHDACREGASPSQSAEPTVEAGQRRLFASPLMRLPAPRILACQTTECWR